MVIHTRSIEQYVEEARGFVVLAFDGVVQFRKVIAKDVCSSCPRWKNYGYLNYHWSFINMLSAHLLQWGCFYNRLSKRLKIVFSYLYFEENIVRYTVALKVQNAYKLAYVNISS